VKYLFLLRFGCDIILLYLWRDFIFKMYNINIRNATSLFIFFMLWMTVTVLTLLFYVYRGNFWPNIRCYALFPLTCIGVARRLHLATIEVKIHMTHWLSQAQEHGRRVQHHYELTTVYVDPFIFLIVFETRLCRIKS